MGDVAVGRHHAVRLAAVNGQELNEEDAFKFLRLAPLKHVRVRLIIMRCRIACEGEKSWQLARVQLSFHSELEDRRSFSAFIGGFNLQNAKCH